MQVQAGQLQLLQLIMQIMVVLVAAVVPLHLRDVLAVVHYLEVVEEVVVVVKLLPDLL